MNLEHALLVRIDHYLISAPRARCEVVERGPFDIFLNRGGKHPYMSYARPARSLDAGVGEGILAVTGVFRDQDYTPRWEYVEELTPELSPALIAAGYPQPLMRPLMIQSEAVLAPNPQGVEIRQVSDSGGLREAASVQRQGFGMGEEEDGPSDPDRLTENGMRFFTAYLDGTAVAAGVQIPLEGTAELAGIATLPDYRRRGIGTALTAAMTHDARRIGCDLVFLSAGDEEIARVYQRAGFKTIGRAADTMLEPA